MPQALLSRFDLLFLLLDTPDRELDTRLAEHVCHVHRTGQAPEDPSHRDSPPLTPDAFRAFVAEAKILKPQIPSHLVEYISDAYAGMRAADVDERDASCTTARTLLAIIRLSQARVPS